MKLHRLLALPAVLVCSVGLAQDNGTKPGKSADAKVLAELHNGNAVEIQEGRLATKQGHSKGVKDLGRMLVEDHAKAEKDVERQVHRLGIDLSVSPEGEKTAGLEELDKLRKMKGMEFDREFVKHVVEEHQKTIKLVEDSLTRAQDKDVRAMLAEMIPTLQRHLERAQQLQSKLGNS